MNFGIICTDRRLADWQVDCLQQLRQVEGVELVAVLAPPRIPAAPARAGRHLFSFRHFLFRLVSALRSNPVETARDAELAGIPEIPYPSSRAPGDVQECVEAIRRREIDFILHLGDEELRGEIVNTTRLGVWTLHQGDPAKHGGRPVGFWEVCNDEPVCRVMLQRLTDDPTVRLILTEGWLAAARHSWRKNEKILRYAARHWPARLCRQLLDQPDRLPEGIPCRMPVTCVPSNLDVLRLVWNQCKHRIRNLRLRLFTDKWNVGIVHAPIHSFLEEKRQPPITWLPEGTDYTFYADPFAIPVNTGHVMLAERFDYAKGVGEIHALQVGTDEHVSDSRVIPLPVHMSYPFLFRHDGGLYCIPETFQSRAVHLFRAERYPDRWRFVANLIEDFAAVDSTIIEYEGRFWLLCTNHDDNVLANLYIWHAKALRGPWMPHARNPVKCDVRSARPAGTPFMHNNALHRPAQDCSRSYGDAVAINRVTKLTPTEFSESTVRVVKPDPDGPYPLGLHTLSAVGDVTLVDGKRSMFMPPWVPRRIKNLSRSPALEAALSRLRNLQPSR